MNPQIPYLDELAGNITRDEATIVARWAKMNESTIENIEDARYSGRELMKELSKIMEPLQLAIFLDQSFRRSAIGRIDLADKYLKRYLQEHGQSSSIPQNCPAYDYSRSASTPGYMAKDSGYIAPTFMTSTCRIESPIVHKAPSQIYIAPGAEESPQEACSNTDLDTLLSDFVHDLTSDDIKQLCPLAGIPGGRAHQIVTSRIAGHDVSSERSERRNAES